MSLYSQKKLTRSVLDFEAGCHRSEIWPFWQIWPNSAPEKAWSISKFQHSHSANCALYNYFKWKVMN